MDQSFLTYDILLLISQIASPSTYVSMKFVCKGLYAIKRISLRKDIIEDSLSNESPKVFDFLKHELKLNITDINICGTIASHGNLPLLKWAHEYGCPWDTYTCINAAEKGHLEMLKYLHEYGCPWNDNTCSCAAYGGHSEVLKYAHDNGCPWDENTCSWAARG